MSRNGQEGIFTFLEKKSGRGAEGLWGLVQLHFWRMVWSGSNTAATKAAHHVGTQSMTMDRETPDRTASGTPQMSVIQGGKAKTPKGTRTPTDKATGLTAAQEQFCQGIMAGLNYTAAYKAAYPNTQATDASIWSIACRLAAEVKVISRLEALKAQKEAERRAQALSLADFVIDGWKQLAQSKIVHEDGTVEEIPPAVRTRNLELIGRHLGMFVERVETKDVTDRSADDIEAQIKARLGIA